MHRGHSLTFPFKNLCLKILKPWLWPISFVQVNLWTLCFDYKCLVIWGPSFSGYHANLWETSQELVSSERIRRWSSSPWMGDQPEWTYACGHTSRKNIRIDCRCNRYLQEARQSSPPESPQKKSGTHSTS